MSERVCEPLYSETGVTPLSSNNFNQTFPVTHDQSCTSAWRNFGPFLLTELLQLRDICGLSCMNGLLQILPHHLSWVNAWTSTLHSKMQNLFCFIQSVVDVLVCLGSSSCCMIHFLLSFSSQTDVLTFSCGISECNPKFMVPSTMASRPGPEAAKQPQTMIIPPPYFTAGMRFLCWNAGFGFHQT